MAGVALGRGGRVGRCLGLGILRYISAAVAGRALSGKAGVVHGGRRPTDEASSVAGVTLTAGWYMRHRLSQCIGPNIAAVVAGRTLGRHSCMTHLRRLEGYKIIVAGVALGCGRDMCGTLAKRTDSVMAGRASASCSCSVSVGRPEPCHG
jgi:hypothetical protein